MNQQVHKRLKINKNTRFLVQQLKSKGQKVMFFIGAGVSSPSGLPLGNQLRDILLMKLYPEYPSWEHEKTFRADFYPDYPKDEDITLEMVLQQLGQRMGYEGIKDFLKPFFGKIKEPSLSHELIATLSKKKYITFILTTNFDNLLEEALRREKVDFRVVSRRTAEIDYELSKKVIIWKLHGDLKKPRSLSITEEDVLHFPKKKRTSLQKIFQNFNIVFIGYSMRDPDVMEVINKVTPKNKKYSFFWVDPAPFTQTSKNIQDTIKRFNLSENYIQMSSDDFFNEINYLLTLRPPVIIWNADEAKVLRGGVRGEGDPWNLGCESYTRVFGAAPNQQQHVDWEGALIQLQARLSKPLKVKKDLCKGASLQIQIPPKDEKGIHGGKGRKVVLYLVKGETKIKVSELVCEKWGRLMSYWPHDYHYRGINPNFFIDPDDVLKHFDGLQNITLELEIESQVCMDVSRFLLYFF